MMTTAFTPSKPPVRTSVSRHKDIHRIKRIARATGLENTLAALELAINLHDGQKRELGGPYILHPVRVALALFALGIREDHILAAALLHDVLEDCEDRLDKKMLARFYALDPRTVTIVQLLTKCRPHIAAQYFGRISGCWQASLIKLADRAHNLATMNEFTQARARKYVKETRLFVMPLIVPKRNGNGHYNPAFEALHREIQFLTRKAEQDFNLRNDRTKHTKCPAWNRTALEAQSNGARYFPLAKPRASASSTPYGSPTAP